MAAKIITINQQKGGAGKTTLAAHLAVGWALSGKRVSVVDIDPQASLTAWSEMRTEKLGEEAASVDGRLSVGAVTGWRIANEIERRAREADIVIVDSPPHAETEAKLAVRAADLVVVPLQPSPMDVWASRTTVKLAGSEGTDALLVLNRVPPRARLTEDLAEAIEGLSAPLAETTIGNRVALAASMLEGKGIGEFQPRSAAAREIAALAQEISG